MVDRSNSPLSAPENDSESSWAASLPAAQRDDLLNLYTEDELDALWWDWRFWARPNQLEPAGEWVIWLLLTGRGFGKTRSGAEWVRERVNAGLARKIALIAATPADARDVMIEGSSGLLAVFPPHQKPLYEPSKRRVTFHTGAMATIYSGYEPDQLRGPNHDTAWGDELATWAYIRETYDNLMFGLRVGEPRAVFTTTPKPLALLRELLLRPDVVVTRGSTYENREHLAPAFFANIVTKYEGTSIGQQELYGDLLEEAEGALWKRKVIADSRVKSLPENIKRRVVAIDPSSGEGDEANDAAGIIIASKDVKGEYYVERDATMRGSPDAWARRAVTAYKDLRADRIVAEKNNGGKMVELVLRTIDKDVPYRAVWASEGKRTRAEPVAALYEQGKVHHVGVLAELEDEQCTWTPGSPSPNRMDALVWAITELQGGRGSLGAFDDSLTRPSVWAEVSGE